MMISLEVSKYRTLRVVCDDYTFGSLEVCIFCVMMISLEVWRFTCFCDDDKFGSLESWKFTYCV